MDFSPAQRGNTGRRLRERFFWALDEVVYNAAFSPEALAVYIGLKIGAARYDTDFSEAILRCKATPKAVRDYLEVTGRIRIIETEG